MSIWASSRKKVQKGGKRNWANGKGDYHRRLLTGRTQAGVREAERLPARRSGFLLRRILDPWLSAQQGTLVFNMLFPNLL